MTQSPKLPIAEKSADREGSGQSPAISAYAAKCDELASDRLFRQLMPRQEGLLDFSHNDYLGLANHPATKAAAREAIETWGTGSRASRLLAGNLELFEHFEKEIAEAKKQSAALIFGSGFQTNSGVLTALLDSKVLGREPRVFSDRLNHSSIHQGCFAAGARQHRYRHLDLDHLEQLLSKYESCPRPKFIISETVFGMDGDVADVVALDQLADRFGALLYLDEAHATGVIGEDGYGLGGKARSASVVVMGTFSKAMGASGGYVACCGKIRDYLVNRCASFIYSTAPAPSAIAAAQAAWNLIPDLADARQRLQQLSDHCRDRIQDEGFSTGRSSTQIIPVLIGDSAKTLEFQQHLKKRNLCVSAIRPPTVPPNSARLRIAVSAIHRESEIDHLVDAMAGVQSEL